MTGWQTTGQEIREATMFISAASFKKNAALTAVALALLLSNCAVTEKRPGHELGFIITGNTGPTSPFNGYPQRLASVYKSINRENIVLAIHTGNLIYGGHEWMGVTRKDIERQFRNAVTHKKLLTVIMYHLVGEMDQYNGKIDLFEHYVAKKHFNSFNYADSHFILLHIMNKDSQLSPGELRWLEQDLEINKDCSAIFVFSHYPVMSSPQSGAQCKSGDELHALFAKYPVKAAISGNTKNFTEFDKDGIRYINAGCSGFNNEDWQQGFFQYYIARYDGLNLFIKGIKVDFGPDTRRTNLMTGAAKKINKILLSKLPVLMHRPPPMAAAGYFVMSEKCTNAASCGMFYPAHNKKIDSLKISMYSISGERGAAPHVIEKSRTSGGMPCFPN
jgi:hypothetical protein